MPPITCIEDLRQLAQQRVPRMFYDYADTGSWTGSTYRANEADFQGLKFRQRVAVNIERRSVATKMIGIDARCPWDRAHRDDGHAARRRRSSRARRRSSHPVHASTMSICSIGTSRRTPRSPGSSST
jgi:L-lactate dehydrogenase (cytochrome)/glycolate oxidase